MISPSTRSPSAVIAACDVGACSDDPTECFAGFDLDVGFDAGFDASFVGGFVVEPEADFFAAPVADFETDLAADFFAGFAAAFEGELVAAFFAGLAAAFFATDFFAGLARNAERDAFAPRLDFVRLEAFAIQRAYVTRASR